MIQLKIFVLITSRFLTHVVWFHMPTLGLHALTLGLHTLTLGLCALANRLCTLPLVLHAPLLGLHTPINLSLGTQTMIIMLTTVISQITITISHYHFLFPLLHLKVQMQMQPMDNPSTTICLKTPTILWPLSLTLGNDPMVIMKL
jgi:hypothetical protein